MEVISTFFYSLLQADYYTIHYTSFSLYFNSCLEKVQFIQVICSDEVAALLCTYLGLGLCCWVDQVLVTMTEWHHEQEPY